MLYEITSSAPVRALRIAPRTRSMICTAAGRELMYASTDLNRILAIVVPSSWCALCPLLFAHALPACRCTALMPDQKALATVGNWGNQRHRASHKKKAVAAGEEPAPPLITPLETSEA